MSDLIRREDAIEILLERAKSLRGMLGDLGGACRGVMRIIELLPSAEPEERKKGKWIYDGIRGRFPACKCSICGHYENADWALLQGVNYCPNCGADMRGEHE